ncbi:TRAP transporter small permease [Actibacterium lipolyticum]|uniref:TRAP transporter small permease protein n=1 Tax=Actibacterium lipolyticum TaxID=1524263 RepID=A0A238JQT9_9RHOB|nr:TRAP transporter small permease [Actibacterium lipolyticum]SMX32222.1 Tripartite ATP-independent periplasmic transporters, DctQ component [Actibacterium lipolyticum]
MYRHIDNSIGWLAKAMALLGGTVLIALIAMTCISIIGRTLVPLGLSPVKGDFEWMELGVGFAIFSFLPWAQYARGHARVDLFTPAFGKTMNRMIDLIADLMMFAASSIIAWRLWLGMLDKKSYTETTFILQFPTWIAYAAGLLGAVAFVIVSAFCILRSARNLRGSTSDQY